MSVTIDETPEPLVIPETPVHQSETEGTPLLLLVPVAAVLLAVGLAAAADTDEGLVAREVVGAGLVAAWLFAGSVVVTKSRLRALGAWVLAGSTGGALTFLACAAVTAEWEGAAGSAAEIVRPVGIGILPAFGLAFLLALPAGRLGTKARDVGVGLGFAVGLAVGVWLYSIRPDLPAWLLWSESILLLACGVPAAHRRYLATAGFERQRLQWIGCAAAVTFEAALVVAALRLFADWPPNGAVVAAAFTVLIPLGLAAGASNRLVTRVDRLLVHTVSLVGLTAVVVAVYLLIVLGLGQVPDDAERHVLVLSMFAAAVSAFLYLPARERLAEAANRLVYGERQAPDEVLRTFGGRLSRAIPMDELLLQLAESLKKTMALDAAEVWTGTGGVVERAVSVPDRPKQRLELGEKEYAVVARARASGNAWISIWMPALLEGRGDVAVRVAPVSHSGELFGLLVAERPAEGDLFGEEDERVLTELARQVGLALHNVELDSALQQSLDEVRRYAEELQASRARIVATADAERRKIERNLHDGAQQHLVALAVNLRLARDIVEDDPATATEMLDQLAASIKDTIQELRDLAHGIYPPLLVDSGLGEALRAAAGRSPLDVTVDADGIGRYPAELEAAIYFCCLEALQNAAKHAPDAHVDIQLRQDDDHLRFSVVDDGPGFDLRAMGLGHGFTNMSDRVGAIGGEVVWNSAPGEGVQVTGSVPATPRTE
jgi:signal transduction histidine kinase